MAMVSSFDDIFSCFLGNVDDNFLVSLEENEAYQYMEDYLRKALTIPYLRKIFDEISVHSDNQTIEYETTISSDLVESFIGRAMAIKWLEPQVNSKLHIAQYFGSKDKNNYSQAQHLKELQSLLHNLNLTLRKEIRDLGYASVEG